MTAPQYDHMNLRGLNYSQIGYLNVIYVKNVYLLPSEDILELSMPH